MTTRFCSAVATAILALTAYPALAANAPLEDTYTFTPDTRAKAGHLIQIGDQLLPDGDAATIDVLVVYTPRMLANLGASDYEFVEYVERTFAEVNNFLRNSQLETRFRVTGFGRWERPAGYSVRSDLDALPAFVETETRLRDETGADLVQLWETPEPGIDQPGLCGWGQVIGSHGTISTRGFGYSAVLRGQPGGEFENCYSRSAPEAFALLVAHELGHNLGSTHGWEDGSGEGVFDFAHGAYCDTGQTGDRPGTIMTASAFRLPIFSNPALSHNGAACGTSAGLPYGADNHHTFKLTAGPVAGLRSEPAGRGEVHISAPSTVAEFAPWFPVTLTRSDSREAASVELAIFSNRARSGVHFAAPWSQQVHFAAGQREVIVPIDLIADSRREADRTLTFWLQRGGNVRIGDARSKAVTIRDNDHPQAWEQPGPRPDYRSVSNETVSSGPEPAGASSDGGGAIAFWTWLPLMLLAIRRRLRSIPPRSV